MSRTLRMEWTKLRTDPGVVWYALAFIAGTVAVTALACATTGPHDCTPRPCTVDAARISLSGLYLGQVPAVVLAVLVISNEYDSMMIRTTLAASPRRIALVLAKAAVTAVVVLTTAVVALAAALLTARLMLPARGFTAANGYPSLLSLADGPTVRAYLGAMTDTGLIALLALGLALITRHTAAAITTALGLLYVAPIVALFVTDPLWQDRIRRYAPMTAEPRVLAAYAAGGLVVGAMLFSRRDS
jgi:ABC-2 type transport system permease protein